MRVKRGDILARLVADTLEAQLAQNDAAHARAQAAAAQARSGIVQAEARLLEANNAFERAKPLRAAGHLAESAYDQREQAARTAQAQLLAAGDGLKVAEAEKRRSRPSDANWCGGAVAPR
jgi:HlyD family secretion protein